MKRIILYIALCFFSLSLMAQEKEILLPKDSIINIDSSDYINQENHLFQYKISMGASFGRGFFGENFTSTHIAPSFRVRLNEQTHLRAGFLTGDVWLNGKSSNTTLVDRAPYANRYKHNAAYVGMDIELSPKLDLFVTAFFDRYNSLQTPSLNPKSQSLYSYGFDASLTYEMSKNSFLNIRVSFLETNNPYMLIPYHHSAFNSMGMLNEGLFTNSLFPNHSPFGW